MKVLIRLARNMGDGDEIAITKDFAGRTRMGSPFTFQDAIGDIELNKGLYSEDDRRYYPLRDGYYKIVCIEDIT
jgi:uncharacterized protein YbaR (Trm112 family)